MNRKFWTLVALAVLFGGVSFYLNKDWFRKDGIQISHRSRPARSPTLRRRPGRTDDPLVNPVTFLFNQPLQFTSVKVIPLSDIQTNKHPHPIWYLVSDSNSIPIKSFFYGTYIKGMRPDVKGAAPDPLEPGVPYRLLVEAGPFKGEHDFTAEPKTP
jgi:hypothetical protein